MKFIVNSTPNASTNQRCTAHGDVYFLFPVDKPRFSTPALVCKLFREKDKYEKERAFLLHVCPLDCYFILSPHNLIYLL